MKKLSFLGTLAASILLAGCGGGGGGGNNNGGSTPVSTQFRALTPVTYAYDQSGTLFRPGSGTQTLNVSSQRTIAVIAGSSAGQFTLDGSDAIVVEGGTAGDPSLALNLDIDVTQQSDRSLLLRSVDVGDGDKVLSSPTHLYLPGTFTTNTTAPTETLSFNDGTSATYSFKVGGQQSVTVPFGTFTTFVVTSSLTFANNNKRTGTYYYAPELGTYVKSIETITRPDGSITTVTSSLRGQS